MLLILFSSHCTCLNTDIHLSGSTQLVVVFSLLLLLLLIFDMVCIICIGHFTLLYRGQLLIIFALFWATSTNSSGLHIDRITQHMLSGCDLYPSLRYFPHILQLASWTLYTLLLTFHPLPPSLPSLQLEYSWTPNQMLIGNEKMQCLILVDRFMFKIIYCTPSCASFQTLFFLLFPLATAKTDGLVVASNWCKGHWSLFVILEPPIYI